MITVLPPAVIPPAAVAALSPTGNDGTAAVGNPALPFLTLPAAIAAVAALIPTPLTPYQISAAPGTWHLPNALVTLPDFCSLIGSGRQLSLFKSDPARNGTVLLPGSFSTIQSLHVDGTNPAHNIAYPIGCANAGKGPAGVLLYDVHCLGEVDALYFDPRIAGRDCTWTALECLLESSGDQVTINPTLATGRTELRLIRCTLISHIDAAPGTAGVCLYASNSSTAEILLRLDSCTITLTGGPAAGGASIGLWLEGPNTRAEIFNSDFTIASADPASDLDLQADAPALLHFDATNNFHRVPRTIGNVHPCTRVAPLIATTP